MFYCKSKYVFSFTDSELGRLWLVKFAILLLLVELLLKYRGYWIRLLKLYGLWKNIFWGTGCWSWFCIIIAWVKICMDLQKLFPKSVIDLEIPCNNLARTRPDSRNVSVNVLQNCASSFVSWNSSWSFCARGNVFSRCFAYSQLILEPDFLLIYVLQMNFTLLVPLLLLSLCTNLINPLLSSFDEAEFNTTDDDEKKLLMKFHFNLMMILVLTKWVGINSKW